MKEMSQFHSQDISQSRFKDEENTKKLETWYEKIKIDRKNWKRLKKTSVYYGIDHRRGMCEKEKMYDMDWHSDACSFGHDIRWICTGKCKKRVK